jgi:Double zinc ribbon
MNDDEQTPLDEPIEPTAPGAAPGPPPGEVEAYAAPPPDAAPAGLAAHSVPATPLGESTRCPRCGTENRPGIAFCRECGQRLIAPGASSTLARPALQDGTTACPRCGTHNRTGAAFCANCGANLRGSPEVAAAPAVTPAPGRALLGPIVLLIGAVGIATGWLLPFSYGSGSLFDRAFGTPEGYGVGFWSAYATVGGGIPGQSYFGFAAPAPLLVALLVVLAVAGVMQRAPGTVQRIGLLVALLWGAGLAVLFVVVELFGGPGGGLLDVLRALSPGGIIFLLAGLIVVIGTLTRLARA